MIAGLCADCDSVPFSHSIILLFKKEGIHTFYSCPSKSIKYNDTTGILNHFNSLLSYYNCLNNYWEIIFDFNAFELKHMLEINTAIGMAKLINTYSCYLLKIQVINTNLFTYSMLQVVLPFLNSSVKDKIIM
jgi:hypothetical protein